MAGPSRAAKTTRTPGPPKPVHTLPEAEHDRHARSDRCACRPSVETWTIEGRVSTRVVHRELAEQLGAPLDGAGLLDDAPRAEQVLPGPRATYGIQAGP